MMRSSASDGQVFRRGASLWLRYSGTVLIDSFFFSFSWGNLGNRGSGLKRPNLPDPWSSWRDRSSDIKNLPVLPQLGALALRTVSRQCLPYRFQGAKGWLAVIRAGPSVVLEFPCWEPRQAGLHWGCPNACASSASEGRWLPDAVWCAGWMRRIPCEPGASWSLATAGARPARPSNPLLSRTGPHSLWVQVWCICCFQGTKRWPRPAANNTRGKGIPTRSSSWAGVAGFNPIQLHVTPRDNSIGCAAHSGERVPESEIGEAKILRQK